MIDITGLIRQDNEAYKEARNFSVRYLQMKGLRPEEAEDVAQTVMIYLMTKDARRYDPTKSPPKAYMRMILRNAMIDFIRDKRRQLEDSMSESEAFLEKEAANPRKDYDANESEYAQNVNKLSNEEKHILSLYYERDMSNKKIGDHIGVPTSTVKTRIRRALAKLRGEKIHSRL